MSVSNKTTATTGLVGKRIGSYRLIRVLGHGGSARVYLAIHVHLGTHVAVKVLRTPSTEVARGQLRNEIRFMSVLKHPNIARMLDASSREAPSFLVMEYALLGTLRQRCPVGTRLPLSTVVTCVKQVAAALQYIHEQGIVHRDVKPENMLLAQDGRLLLSDFGIAISAYQAGSDHNRFGTAPYSAPEQIRGNPCPASDQYALAIVVYEWLVGYPPFDGSSQEIMHQHLVAPPPPLRDKVQIPLAVELVVMKALAKDPARRFASVAQFAQALEQAAKHPLERRYLPNRRYRVAPYPARQTERTLLPHPHTQPSAHVAGLHQDAHINAKEVLSCISTIHLC